MTVDARRNICPTFTTTTTNNIVRFLRHILPGRISFQRAKVPLPVNHAFSSSFFFFLVLSLKKSIEQSAGKSQPKCR